MPCPLLNECNINLTEESYKKQCTKDKPKCWKYLESLNPRKYPREWLKGGET